MDEINLRKFDMKKVKKDTICALLAPRNSGKSFLVRDILYHHRDLSAGLVISKTDHMAHFYDKFIPSMLIHDTYNPDLIDNLFKRQKKALAESWRNPYCFLIFDDTLSEASIWKKDPRVKEIFFNGRHYKIFFILTMQAPLGITPELRGNIDYTFILRTNNTQDRKKLYEHYAGVFPTREIFEKVLDACTENYGCLVIDNTNKSNKLEDSVFFYKADAHDDLKICDEAFWRKSEEIRLKRNMPSLSTKKITVRKIR